MLRNLTKASLAGLALVMTMMFSSLVSAETVDFYVPLNGFSDVQSGELDESGVDTLIFAVNPNESVSIYAVIFGAKPEIDSVSIKADGSEVASGGPNDTISFAYDSTKQYSIVLTGQSGDKYSFQLAAVPLPAAAWLFLSLIGGGAWLKRRRRTA